MDGPSVPVLHFNCKHRPMKRRCAQNLKTLLLVIDHVFRFNRRESVKKKSRDRAAPSVFFFLFSSSGRRPKTSLNHSVNCHGQLSSLVRWPNFRWPVDHRRSASSGKLDAAINPFCVRARSIFLTVNRKVREHSPVKSVPEGKASKLRVGPLTNFRRSV